MINKIVLKQVKEMFTVDQDIRFKVGPGPKKELGNYLVYAIDNIHNYKLHKLISEYAYPTVKLIGKNGMRLFWLLIQHQDSDLVLQEYCLRYCDFAPKEAARLTDRILINKGGKQIYGTQMRRLKSGRLILSPVQSEKKMSILRKQVGLDVIKKYVESVKRSDAKGH